MIVTGNLIAQWTAIVVGFIYFLWRQGNEAGVNKSQLGTIEKELVALRETLNVRMAKVERRVFHTGSDGFLTNMQHDKACSTYQQLLTERIAQNAAMFERSTATMEKMSDKMDEMDRSRDDQREVYDTRLRAIERSIDKMDGTITNLATIIDRREEH